MFEFREISMTYKEQCVQMACGCRAERAGLGYNSPGRRGNIRVCDAGPLIY